MWFTGGELITFYSYKGGTGRTMALANAAYLLAKAYPQGRVLAVDWDLEAPGLHRYFRGYSRTAEGQPQALTTEEWQQAPGLIELFTAMRHQLGGSNVGSSEDEAQRVLDGISFHRFVHETDVAGLDVLKAGRFDEGYGERVITFSWEDLHNRSPHLIRAFGQLLATKYRYVLVDSRTGITDTSGICTSILPDKLVLVFTPNRQSLFGAIEMGRRAAQYRLQTDDLRSLILYPLPARIEASEPVLRDWWRLGNADADIPGYQPLFETLFRELYALEECALDAYFTEVQVQHVPRFAYGEEIAARVESGDRLSLTRSLEAFLERLVGQRTPWVSNQTDEHVETRLANQSSEWFQERRQKAETRLRAKDLRGFLESCVTIAPELDYFAHKELYSAAERAQVWGVGWPIGAVLPASPEERPRLLADGIEAEIEESDSYDMWSLRGDGSFYFLRNYEEEGEYLLADDRVERVTELLLYCQRLYTFLRVPNWFKLHVDLRFAGLRGRELGQRVPDLPDGLIRLAGASVEDEAEAKIVTEIGRIRVDLKNLVTELCRPLFLRFMFFELSDFEFNRLIEKNLRNWGFLSVSE